MGNMTDELREDLDRLARRDAACGSNIVPDLDALAAICAQRLAAGEDLRRRRHVLASRLSERPGRRRDDTAERERATAEHLAASLDRLSERRGDLVRLLQIVGEDRGLRQELRQADLVRDELEILIDERVVRLEHLSIEAERDDAWLVAHCLDIVELGTVEAALDTPHDLTAVVDVPSDVLAETQARIDWAAWWLQQLTYALPADILTQPDAAA